MNKKEIIKNKKRVNQKGFSLIELLAAMIIFLIVSVSIYGLLKVGTVDRNRAGDRSDIIKNARMAIHLIGRDAFNAGFGYSRQGARVPDNFLKNTFNLKPDADTERDLLTSIVTGDNLFGNTLLSDPSAKTDLIAFSVRDDNFNNGNVNDVCNPDPAVTCNGNPIAVKDVTAQGTTPRIETRLATGASPVRAFDLFLLESTNSQIAAIATATTANTVSFSSPGSLGLNQQYDNSLLRKCTAIITTDCTDYSATVMTKFNLVSYRVNADGTLIRTIYGNNRTGGSGGQIQEQPVAYNIEDMQISYVLDTADASVTDKPTAGPDGDVGTSDDIPSNNNLIRQINIMIKVQSTEIDQQTREPLRITLNASFSTRNLEYDVK